MAQRKEKARQLRAMRKFGKQVQVAAEARKQTAQKQGLAAIERFKEEQQQHRRDSSFSRPTLNRNSNERRSNANEGIICMFRVHFIL